MTKEEFIQKLVEQDYNYYVCSSGCHADVLTTDSEDNDVGYESLPYDEGCEPDCFIEALQYIKKDPMVLEPVYGIIGYRYK